MESITKVSFGTSRIQKLRRLALDSNLLKTLGLEEGDSVQVELDVPTATILIRKSDDTQTRPCPKKVRGA